MKMMEKSTKSTSEADLHQLMIEVRKDIVRMTAAAQSGHPGGSLSAVEILTALYFRIMRHDPKNPKWDDRDRFILSKGHATPVYYSILAHAGYFSTDQLLSFRKLGSPLQGHPDMRRIPAVEASTGSLGQGLSIGIGTALARRFSKKDYVSYVLMSDGEMNEGQTWEAAAFAAHHQLDHLVLIVDCNQFQLSDSTKKILDMEPLAEKWRAFHWETIEVDGHNLDAVTKALEKAKSVKGKPVVIIARTIKGKGVSFMEGNNHFHGVAPTKDEEARALKELDSKR